VAVIDDLPSPDVIRHLKGALDYYVWRGLVCVRTWPRNSNPLSRPAEAETAFLFGDFSKRVKLLSPLLYETAQLETKGTAWTWKEAVTRAAYGNLHIW
jgi:hypothetical protein